MRYTAKQSADFSHECRVVIGDLQTLFLGCVTHGQTVNNARAREHMLHGAARRLGVIRRSVENIFNLFPPSLDRPLARDALDDIEINLHAFVINLNGIFDNWAWAFVLRHDLESDIGDRRNVGLFKGKTQRLLPATLKEYLESMTMTQWHEHYLKSYRDALAHRIPLYLPPAEWTQEESEHYNRLEAEKIECIKSMRWERLEAVRAEQGKIGRPCLTFLHAFSKEEASRPVYLHPQLLCDSKAVVEFGTKYLGAWHERA